MNLPGTDMEQSLRSCEKEIEALEALLPLAGRKEKSLIEAKLSDWRERRKQVARLLIAEVKRKMLNR